MARVQDEFYEDTDRHEIELEIRQKKLPKLLQEVEDKENERMQEFNRQLNMTYENVMKPELDDLKQQIADMDDTIARKRERIVHDKQKAKALKDEQEQIHAEVQEKDARKELLSQMLTITTDRDVQINKMITKLESCPFIERTKYLKAELENMFERNEQYEKEMHFYVKKIAEIDHHGEEHERFKKEHNDNMKVLREQHEEMVQKLEDKEKELKNLEMQKRIESVEAQLDARCQGKKRSELGKFHVLMNLHNADEHESQIEREDANYVSYAMDLLDPKKNPAGNAIKMHLERNPDLGDIAEINKEIEQLKMRPAMGMHTSRTLKGEEQKPYPPVFNHPYPMMEQKPTNYAYPQSGKFFPHSLSTFSLSDASSARGSIGQPAPHSYRAYAPPPGFTMHTAPGLALRPPQLGTV